jgi:predicted nucleic acid-binding protein
VSRGWLIDTNIVSEWVKPRPDARLVSWLEEVDEDRVFLSVVSLAEIRFGVELLAQGRRRTRLDQWLREQLPERFEGRVVPVDGQVADACGRLLVY